MEIGNVKSKYARNDKILYLDNPGPIYMKSYFLRLNVGYHGGGISQALRRASSSMNASHDFVLTQQINGSSSSSSSSSSIKEPTLRYTPSVDNSNVPIAKKEAIARQRAQDAMRYARAAAAAAAPKGQRCGRLVLLRHGESIWNVEPVRFTGWADVPLTQRGKMQAQAAGRCMRAFGINPNAVYTSLLRRSKDSFDELKNSADPDYYENITVINSWRLNERHYGALVGLSKNDAIKKLGLESVIEYRRSWDKKPPKMDIRDISEWESQIFAKPTTSIHKKGKETITFTEKGVKVPDSESLSDCCSRALPLWENGIKPRLLKGETVLVVAHANSIRALIKHIDSDTLTETGVRKVTIPSAIPLVYDFIQTGDKRSSSAEESLSDDLEKMRNILNDNKDKLKRLVPVGPVTKIGMRGRYIATKELIELNLNYAFDAQCMTEHESMSAFNVNNKLVRFFDQIDKDLESVLNYIDMDEVGKSDAFIITDGQGFVIHSNNTWNQLCGFEGETIIGRKLKFLQGPLTDQKSIEDMNLKLAVGLPVRNKLINYRKSGTAFVNEFTVLPIYDWLSKRMAHHNINSPSFNNDKISNSAAATRPFITGPSHFLCRLEKTPDRPDLEPMSEAEKENRWLFDTEGAADTSS